jgi:hypothetical protein
MFDRDRHRAEFLENLPPALEKLVDACRILPRVEPDGSSPCGFARQLFAQKEDAVIPVRKLRAEREARIAEIEKSIEADRNASTEPWWATEDDKIACTPRFDSYCNQKWAKEAEIEQRICESREWIARLEFEIDIIDEFLARAAERTYPGEPSIASGQASGKEAPFDPRAWRDQNVQKFLKGR